MAKCLVISKKYFTKSQFDVTGIFTYTVKELLPITDAAVTSIAIIKIK